MSDFNFIKMNYELYHDTEIIYLRCYNEDFSNYYKIDTKRSYK